MLPIGNKPTTERVARQLRYHVRHERRLALVRTERKKVTVPNLTNSPSQKGFNGPRCSPHILSFHEVPPFHEVDPRHEVPAF